MYRLKIVTSFAAAHNLNNYQGVSGIISYNGDQIVERGVMLAHFEDGKWRKVE